MQFSRSKKSQTSDTLERVGLVAAGAAFAWLTTFVAKRRQAARERAAAALRHGVTTAGHGARRASGVAHKVTGAVSRGKDYDDATLRDKVESELFRAPDAPKGAVNVSVAHGVVELRGQLESEEQIERLAKAAKGIAGVQDVRNLMHTPGTEPGHSPPSDPDEVRERSSRFAREQAEEPVSQDNPITG